MKFIQGSNSTNPLLFPQCCDILRLHDSGTNWINIEPSRGSYNWKNLDYYLAACKPKGIDLMYTMSGIPQWAALPGFVPTSTTKPSQGPSASYPPDPALYSYFLDVLLDHVGTQIKYWEIKNEWNAPGYYVGSDAQLLECARVMYAKIKRAAPDAVVLMPTPSPQPWKKQSVSQAIAYLLGLGFQQYCDAIGFHGYLNQGEDSADISPEIDAIHYQMTRFNVNLPVFDTESGYMESDFIPDASKPDWIDKWVDVRLYKGVAGAGWYCWNNLNSVRWGAPMVMADGSLTAGGQAMTAKYKSLRLW